MPAHFRYASRRRAHPVRRRSLPAGVFRRLRYSAMMLHGPARSAPIVHGSHPIHVHGAGRRRACATGLTMVKRVRGAGATFAVSISRSPFRPVWAMGLTNVAAAARATEPRCHRPVGYPPLGSTTIFAPLPIFPKGPATFKLMHYPSDRSPVGCVEIGESAACLRLVLIQLNARVCPDTASRSVDQLAKGPVTR